MKPVEFPQQTMVLAKDQPQYDPFPVHFDANLGACVGCFELTDEERAAIAAGGKLWIWQYTFGQPFQPVALTTDNPWSTEQPVVTEAVHPDDAAVDAFAVAMKEKLAAARAKGQGGWDDTSDPDMHEHLCKLLRGHVEKGDPRDVANFCMFLHQRGEAIRPAPTGALVEFFRGEGQQLGIEGDACAWTPEQTAIYGMRRYLQLAGYQSRVGTWMGECFPRALYGDMTQRCDRFLEESLELLQAQGYDRTRVATLVDYVWNRPAGEPRQEVGGTVVTLAALCWVAGFDMQGEALRELARIEQPAVMAKIQAKQQLKNAMHFDSPLPGNATFATPDGAN